MSTLDCPYCGHEQDIFHENDSLLDGNTHKWECSNCEKIFVFEAEVTIDYYSHEADCLNDGNHIWGYSFASISRLEWLRMECSACGEIRNPSQDEIDTYNRLSLSTYKKP